MDKKNLAFDKMNFILLGIGMAIIILGFSADEWRRF